MFYSLDRVYFVENDTDTIPLSLGYMLRIGTSTSRHRKSYFFLQPMSFNSIWSVDAIESF